MVHFRQEKEGNERRDYFIVAWASIFDPKN